MFFFFKEYRLPYSWYKCHDFQQVLLTFLVFSTRFPRIHPTNLYIFEKGRTRSLDCAIQIRGNSTELGAVVMQICDSRTSQNPKSTLFKKKHCYMARQTALEVPKSYPDDLQTSQRHSRTSICPLNSQGARRQVHLKMHVLSQGEMDDALTWRSHRALSISPCDRACIFNRHISELPGS